MTLTLLGLSSCTSSSHETNEPSQDAGPGSRDAESTDAMPDTVVTTDGPLSPDRVASTDSASVDSSPGPGVFLAVGYGGRRVRSLDDGMTWVDDQQLEASGGDDMMNLRVVTWGDHEFVALGWRVMTSPDGNTWTDLGTSPLGNWIGGVTYAENEFVAVGGYGLRDISTNAMTWTSESIDTTATHAYDGVAFGSVGAGMFVSANDSGQRSYSSDGTHWAYSTSLTGTSSTHMTFGNGVFVGIGGTAVVTSTDGMNWTSAATLSASPGSVLFAAGHFTAVADGHVFTSNDGTTWTDQVSSSANAGQIAYGDGTYVWANGISPRRSTDGINWTVVTLTGTNSLNSVTFATP
jgi:hypothetical protein